MQQGGDARWEEFDKHDAGFAPPPAEYNAAEWQSPPEDDFYEDGTQFSAGAWAGGVTQGFKDLAGGVSSTVQGLKTYDFKAGAKDVFKMPSKADFEARINGVKEATAAHNGAGLVLLLLATLIIAGMALSLHLISEMDFDPPMINVNFTYNTSAQLTVGRRLMWVACDSVGDCDMEAAD